MKSGSNEEPIVGVPTRRHRLPTYKRSSEGIASCTVYHVLSCYGFRFPKRYDALGRYWAAFRIEYESSIAQRLGMWALYSLSVTL